MLKTSVARLWFSFLRSSKKPESKMANNSSTLRSCSTSMFISSLMLSFHFLCLAFSDALVRKPVLYLIRSFLKYSVFFRLLMFNNTVSNFFSSSSMATSIFWESTTWSKINSVETTSLKLSTLKVALSPNGVSRELAYVCASGLLGLKPKVSLMSSSTNRLSPRFHFSGLYHSS